MSKLKPGEWGVARDDGGGRRYGCCVPLSLRDGVWHVVPQVRFRPERVLLDTEGKGAARPVKLTLHGQSLVASVVAFDTEYKPEDVPDVVYEHFWPMSGVGGCFEIATSPVTPLAWQYAARPVSLVLDVPEGVTVRAVVLMGVAHT